MVLSRKMRIGRKIASLLACFLEENAMRYILFEIQNEEIKED